MSKRTKFALLNGLLLVMLAVLWLSTGAGPGLGGWVHVMIGLLFPVVLLLVAALLCRGAQVSARGIAVRLSYAFLLITSAVGALAWGVKLPHVMALHYWCALISVPPMTVALALSVKCWAQDKASA